jgi:hypothetical protein
MDPVEEKVVKFYLMSIASLIVFAIMFSTVASFQKAEFVPRLSASVITK